MASELDHIAQANKNQECLELMLPLVANHPEWLATIAFYKAVHLVEAALSRSNKHSTSHDDRGQTIKTHPHLRSCYNEFQALKQASVVARYMPDIKFLERYPDPVDLLIKKRLVQVERYVKFQLTEDAKKRMKLVSDLPC